MNEMSLNIKKIHFDLKGENFLILEQKAFEVDYYMMNNNDMLTILRMKNISLYDKDIDEKKNNVVLEQFQCLMNSSQNINNNTINFIDMTSLYRKIDGTTEIDTIFDMNDLNIIISFESLLRIYQFMMYYYDKYNEMVYNIEHPQEKEERKKKLEVFNLSAKNFSKYSFEKPNEINNINNTNIADFKRKIIRNRNKRCKKRISSQSIKILKENHFNKKNFFKKEKIDSKITIIYNMKNTIFKIPLNPKDSDTPIVSFSFNLIYNQKMRNLYTNIWRLPQNLLIEKIYEIEDSTMNLLISKVYLSLNSKNIILLILYMKMKN